MSKTGKKKKGRSLKPKPNGNGCLSEHVRVAMDKYFADMDGHEPKDLYELILCQVEEPLFEIVLAYTDGNVSRAAEVLGLNRGTLRNRLLKYDLQ
jgi:Fis family transcriptional regulator